MTTRKDLAAAYKTYREAVAELRSVANGLPDYERFHLTLRGEPCGWESEEGGEKYSTDDGAGQVVTEGLAQCCAFSGDDLNASTDGWDDMGDMDGPSWIVCDCGQVFGIPRDMGWN